LDAAAGLLEVLQAIYVVYSPAAQWGLDGGWSHSKSAGFCADVVLMWQGRKPANRISPRLAFFPPLILFVIFTDPTVFVTRGFLVSSMAFYGLAGMWSHEATIWEKEWVFWSFLAAISLPFFTVFGISTLAVSIVDQSSFANGKNG
jgi:hypothetical protein